MPDDMAATDRTMMEGLGVSQEVLIERASYSAFKIIKDNKEYGLEPFNTLIVCGTGNNGADALALARHLYEDGIKSDIYICGDLSKTSDGFSRQKKILDALKFSYLEKLPESSKYYSLIVDGLFGISLNRPVEGKYLECINFINECRNQHNGRCKVLSIDMPSGISSVTGQIMGAGVQADITVTFGYKKTGAVLYPGTQYCGRLVYEKSGFMDEALKFKTNIRCLEDSEIAFPERPPYSNKGTFGKLLLIAGNPKVCGAALLAGLAAMKAGLGMLKVVTAIENREAFSKVLPEAMLECYAGDLLPQKMLDEALKWCDCIAIGPGLSTSNIARQLTEFALGQNKVPVVFDADALNIIAENPSVLLDKSQDCIITPHVGEMSRLTGISVSEIQTHLLETAADFAKNYETVVVLKDARTIVASPFGEIIVNTSGNSGMATAGSGDVLTGIIGALFAGGMSAFKAAYLGCALHGKAGDVASGILSESEIIARDIIKYLDSTIS